MTRGTHVMAAAPTGRLPAGCACCGAPPTTTRALRTPDRFLDVPYCGTCREHSARADTRALAATLAALVAGAATALLLPLAWSNVPLVVHLTAAGTTAALPPLVVALAARRPAPGHSAVGDAVRVHPGTGRIACARLEWAVEAAALSGLPPPEPAESRDFAPRRAWLAAPAAIALAGVAHRAFHPEVRVLNVTGERLSVQVDGRHVGDVAPAAGESPNAVTGIAVPAGERVLRAVGPDGRTVEEVRVLVDSGRRHLFAPGATDRCFWLETETYGRVHEDAGGTRALAGPARFWVIPEDVDVWFAPSPADGASDRRSSGGRRTALRQARCDDAPRAVREAMANLRNITSGGTNVGP